MNSLEFLSFHNLSENDFQVRSIVNLKVCRDKGMSITSKGAKWNNNHLEAFQLNPVYLCLPPTLCVK